MKQLRLALLAMLLGVAMVPAVASVSNADGLDGLVTGEAESFALRVEYDVPLPASPGTIPYSGGEIRRSSAGENSKGIAGAPTRFDAVVGGTYADPKKDTKGDENRPPQAECFYPGALVDTAFAFPTDTREETAGLPPISRATAQCAAGPLAELHASVDAFDGPGLAARNLDSSTLIHTVKGVARSTTGARASGINIADGAVTIGGVEISSDSNVTGAKGGNATTNRLSINDVSVGGLQFSIADDRLIVAGEAIPLGGNAAQGVIDQANTFLAASACRIDILTNPGRYPQGFLFSRPEPRVGVSEDGTFAGSMRAGLLVICDLPESVTGQIGDATGTGLSPQRVQVVVGFAYSATSATADPGGFNLGNLFGDGGGLGLLPNISITSPLTFDAPIATAPLTDAGPVRRALAPTRRLVPAVTHPLDSSTRVMLFVVCLAAWLALTHLGITRLRKTS